MRLSPACNEILSGADKRLGARLLRVLLGGMESGYRAAAQWRNRRYDTGAARTESVEARVISVGNITVGGTGKTPLVVLVTEVLRAKGYKTAILTRGYKAGAEGADEVRLFERHLPGTAVVVDADRVRGARQAIRDYGAEVLVLDDGFQHRRLGRDLDVVTIDATCPLGYGRVLPRGLLREPLEGLARADGFVITRSDMVGEEELRWIEGQLREWAGDRPMWRAVHEVAGLTQMGGQEVGAEVLKGRKVLGFAGIGNPGALGATLRKMGATVVGELVYGDHHDYEQADLQQLERRAEQSGAEMLVTTEKDAVKLEGLDRARNNKRLHWLGIRMTITGQRERFAEMIEKAAGNQRHDGESHD